VGCAQWHRAPVGEEPQTAFTFPAGDTLTIWPAADPAASSWISYTPPTIAQPAEAHSAIRAPMP